MNIHETTITCRYCLQSRPETFRRNRQSATQPDFGLPATTFGNTVDAITGPKTLRALLGVQRLCVTVVMLLAFIPAAFAQQPLTFVGFDKSSHSPAAHDGLQEILSGRCFHVGLPVEAMKAMAKTRTTPSPELGYDPNSSQGQFYATGKIPSPPERKSELALGDSMFVRNNVKLVNRNCFGCHAGVVNGQVVAGLANNHMLPPTKSSDVGDRPDMSGIQSVLTSDDAKKEFNEYLAGPQSVKLNLPDSPSRGDHFGPFVVWSSGAHLADPERKGLIVSDKKTELVKIIESTRVPNVDPMPWWLMKYKERAYWYADGGIHDAAHFSFSFTTPHPEVNENRKAHVESTAKALAFARETRSPLFPKLLDASLVRKGADLFHGRIKPLDSKGFKTCKTCHGTYTKNASQPDLGTPGGWTVFYKGSTKLKDVKTDDTYNATLQKFRPIAERINKLAAFYEAEGHPSLSPRFSVPTSEGYVAPPLVGVWASAPYFHNGSVPTVEAVLNSTQRPEIWSRNIRDPHAYDLADVGLQSIKLSRTDFTASAESAATAQPLSKAAIDHQAIYDTKNFGHGNQGHTFGDRLTKDERAAVVEFLKSLSGPDMNQGSIRGGAALSIDKS